MVIKISTWERHYPDGVSLATHNRIGRLIRRYGTVAKITILEWTEDGLRKALDGLEGK